MKLFFDARFIRTDFHDGISRYSTELGNALAALTPVTFIICKTEQKAFLPKDAPTVMLNDPTSSKEPFAAKKLNAFKPDVVFSPMQTLGSSGRQFKLILTLHDLIYYRHRMPPRHLSPALRLGWRLYHSSYVPQRLTLNKADVVATVSETSKRDILKVKLTKCPIIVVPNAPRDLKTLLKTTPIKQEDLKNIVYMGSFMPYKDIETLLSGMAFLPGRTLHLLSRITKKRQKELEKCIPAGAKVIFYNGVTDEKYADLLADDAISVSASLDEGYGLPLAEGLALGVPSVVTDLAIFREVAGNGALYFAPKNPQDFAEKIKQLDDNKIRQELIEAGKQHIGQFSWEKSAQILLDTVNTL